MKFMGSKRALLASGLGALLLEEAKTSTRFVDLFSGTGRVAWHVAENSSTPVIAADLQNFARTLASAVIERTRDFDPAVAESEWLIPALSAFEQSEVHESVRGQDWSANADAVCAARILCETVKVGPIFRAYGGHYYSPYQAALIDALIEWLPDGNADLVKICRGALVWGASRCAAAPGHTAQPFQPRGQGLRHIRDAWARSVVEVTRSALVEICSRYAQQAGKTVIADANTLAKSLDEDDLVFADPPYSAVHYSRFYHVLETVALGSCGPVAGVGRYPPSSERPRSMYSMASTAADAFRDLFQTLSSVGCKTIVTFPAGKTSSGVSGEFLCEMASELYHVDSTRVESCFSTLGGDGNSRSARLHAPELLIVLTPRAGL